MPVTRPAHAAVRQYRGLPGVARELLRRWRVDTQLWRGLAVYRALALVYTAAQFGYVSRDYAHAGRGWAVLAGMTVWTVAVTWQYAAASRRTTPALVLDLIAAVAAILLAGLADDPAVVAERTLPMLWAAAAVVACALARGWVAGLVSTGVVACASIAVRHEPSATVVNNAVLLALAASVLGWVAAVARSAEQARAEAAAVRAQQRERDRLGRAVHDGVLQVLAQVARRSGDLGPEGARLAHEAATQEASLRALLSSGQAHPASDGIVDLVPELAALGRADVEVAVPAHAVPVAPRIADELTAAVREALGNTSRHSPGAHAWVLVEDTGAEILVTVRDNGDGFAPGRIAAAAAEGRMGVSRSIIGRLHDIGGRATITSTEGGGVEVVMAVPREERDDDTR